ncbi:MAG: hypothetical protein HS101_20000 [Planctomycetia bacterium]|nr:hypothetical protein [Planctomycetia bacterium]
MIELLVAQAIIALFISMMAPFLPFRHVIEGGVSTSLICNSLRHSNL